VAAFGLSSGRKIESLTTLAPGGEVQQSMPVQQQASLKVRARITGRRATGKFCKERVDARRNGKEKKTRTSERTVKKKSEEILVRIPVRRRNKR